jgi:hypothetical protein
MKITETIFDVVTQETTVIERELTADEVAERKAAADAQAAERTAIAAAATAKAALLEKLGITEDEAKLLLS